MLKEKRLGGALLAHVRLTKGRVVRGFAVLHLAGLFFRMRPEQLRSGIPEPA